MASKSKNQKNSLSIEKKIEVLEALKSKNQAAVAKEFNVDQSTISRIKKQEASLREVALVNGNLSRKRKRESPHEEIGNALIVWFEQMKAQNAPISGPLMMEKAKQLATGLGYESFNPTNGWLERLKNRHNIKFMKISGERAAADQVAAENWIQNVLPKEIDGYESDDIFNADETGFIFFL